MDPLRPGRRGRRVLGLTLHGRKAFISVYAQRLALDRGLFAPRACAPGVFVGRLGPALGQQIVAKLVRGLALLSRLVQDAVELRAPIALAVVADGT